MDGGTELKKLLLSLGLALGLTSSALAGNPSTSVGNANYTATNTDSRLVPTVALTANRTWTLPPAASTCVGAFGSYGSQGNCGNSFDIVDSQGNVGGSNSCINIVPTTGDNLNGGNNTVTFCETYGRVVLRPIGGTNWVVDDNEIQSTGFCIGSGTTGTVTFTTATPTVVTDTTYFGSGGVGNYACPVTFTSTAQLPTGVASGATPYWIIPSTVANNTYQIATSIQNALANPPVAVATTGAGAGTNTRNGGAAVVTNTAVNISAVGLTPGNWDCRATVARASNATASFTKLNAGLTFSNSTVAVPSQGLDASTYFTTAANVTAATAIDSKIGPAVFTVPIASAGVVSPLFLIVNDTFTVAWDSATGQIECRRMQ
jgi:hypothetical protein